MRVFDIELLFHLFVMVLGYGLGCGASILTMRILGLVFAGTYAAWLVLCLPLAGALIVEGLTEFWLGTPGTVGLGSLWVFLPLFVSGLALGLAVCAAQRFVAPYPHHFARGHAVLDIWLGMALAGVLLTVALWRFWPAPVARLW